MKKEIAEGLTNFELAELAIERLPQYEEYDVVNLAETLDRSDMLRDLEDGGIIE